MTGAPEHAYTDRDVRETAFLTDLAIEYLHNYGGSYEPLLNAQQMLRSEGQLTTQITRIVLNCMRHDVNVASQMPKPGRFLMSVPDITQDSFTSRRKKKKDDVIIVQCGQLSPHSVHYVNPTNKCNGIPHRINRHPTETKITVKTPYARARTGKFWHHVDTSKNACYARWYPPSHRFGWADHVDLYVKTVCKYPSILTNPILMKTVPSREVEEHLLLVTECPWCIDILSTPEEFCATHHQD